jgi:hypothetical protein
LLIQEKNAENSRIQEWQRTWNANIDTLSFDDLKDVKSILVKSKLTDLKHYSNEYEEIYTSTEKRLHSQIELISKAEEQRIAQEKFAKEQAEIAEKNRIAQEKFLAEKKEFEEKQRNAKIKERQNHLKTLNVDLSSLLPVLGISKHSLFINALNNFPDDAYEVELKELLEFIKPKKEETVVETTQEVELIPRYGSDSPAFGVEESAPIIYKAFGDQSEKVLENIKNKTHELLDEDKVFYTGTLKNLTEDFVSFELTFFIKDLPKFEHLTLKDFLKNYNQFSKKQ